ncbi:MAG: hypothetical protein MUC97_02175 [Bernardetiaceae bacterium]|jgi:hypothetical protein|nr:hypothetical protein [Bernardetiaceae bacterium]
MNLIKQFFLQRKVRAVQREVKRPRSTMSYAEVRQVGVFLIAHEEEHQRQLTQFIRALQRDNKQVTVLTYFGKQRDIAYPFEHEFFTEADIDLWGEVHSASVLHFVQKPFDYLYCLSLDEPLVQDWLLATSNAKCRIGPHWQGKEHLFEMMVALSPGQGLGALIEQVQHYTKALVAH